MIAWLPVMRRITKPELSNKRISSLDDSCGNRTPISGRIQSGNRSNYVLCRFPGYRIPIFLQNRQIPADCILYVSSRLLKSLTFRQAAGQSRNHSHKTALYCRLKNHCISQNILRIHIKQSYATMFALSRLKMQRYQAPAKRQISGTKVPKLKKTCGGRGNNYNHPICRCGRYTGRAGHWTISTKSSRVASNGIRKDSFGDASMGGNSMDGNSLGDAFFGFVTAFSKALAAMFIKPIWNPL